jgi:hypothetical protein
MTVSEMMMKLTQLNANGLGDLQVLIRDPDNGWGCGVLHSKYQVGHCDSEGYVWHSDDTTDCVETLSEDPDVVMFY